MYCWIIYQSPNPVHFKALCCSPCEGYRNNLWSTRRIQVLLFCLVKQIFTCSWRNSIIFHWYCSIAFDLWWVQMLKWSICWNKFVAFLCFCYVSFCQMTSSVHLVKDMWVYAVKVMGRETEGLRDGEKDRQQPAYDVFSNLLPTVWQLVQSVWENSLQRNFVQFWEQTSRSKRLPVELN